MGAGFDTEKVHYTVESKRVLNLLSRAQTICDPMDWEAPQSLVGYSPWGHKESDTTEQLHSLNKAYKNPIA